MTRLRLTGTLRVRGLLLAVAFFAATAAFAGQPAECGDIDGNGEVVAADALLVLRKAIGLPVSHQCIVVGTTTSTSSTIFIDECFDDSDCTGNPDGPHCCAYECAQCDRNEHCGEGQYCSSGCECLPLP